jgi:hypothetical protein
MSSKRLKLKGIKWACQDLQPSLMQRQVTCLLLKTISESPKPLCLYSRQEKEVSRKGEVDESQEDKLDCYCGIQRVYILLHYNY